MKKLATFILTFTCLFLYSQENYKVLYKLRVDNDIIKIDDKDRDETIKGYLKKINEGTREYADDFTFSLLINKNESHFESIPLMEADYDKLKIKLAKIFFKTQNKYYLNSKTREKLSETFAYDKCYIVKDSIDSKWQITNEQKKIGEFNCYKASTTKTVINSKGTFNWTITAWFSTDLPFSFGPIGYGGLPGLILELQEEDTGIIYYASKLIPKKNLKIEKPSKGKLVTQKEYDEIVMNSDISFD